MGLWLLPGLLAAALLPVPAVWPQAPAAESADADDLLVVHCLLPGQLRRLGQRTTYLSARRPVKTTALDCRVRGGEYVVSDRASLASALKVWLGAAQQGEALAQVTLGEIYEQGLGVAADYEVARQWYEKAAAQQVPRAYVNLGNLYERGLGVTADAARALHFYRLASGLPAQPRPQTQSQSLALQPGPDVAPLDALLHQDGQRFDAALQQVREEAAALRRSLAEAEQSLQRSRAELWQQGEQDKLVQQLRQTLQQKDEEITSLQGVLADLSAADPPDDLLRQLELMQNRSRQQQAQLLSSRQTLAEKVSLERTLRRTIEEQLAALAERDRVVQGQLQNIQNLLGEIEQLKSRRQARPLQAVATAEAQALLAGPSITLVEPVLPSSNRTRGLQKVSLPRASAAAAQAAQIVGRVDAAAGLLTLTVNSQPVQPNPAGVFVHTLSPAQSQVTITAIDQLGKRSDLEFEYVAEVPAENQIRPPPQLGTYHALLIGNNRYRNLPSLKTPHNDVDTLEQILTDRYGFRVQTLRDADRYTILSALNELRGRLTGEDNLLVYYAGHGELDRKNMRGHWLPVDAELNSSANWISNVAVTDILNVIAAKQIMLVVDSCYSGTLTRSTITRLQAARTAEEQATWLKLMAAKKARVVLTSGGLAPVLDAGGGNYSVFANAFIQVLRANSDLITGQAIYQAVTAKVAHAASRYEFEQIPAFAAIARAGHEAGDFLLLPGGGQSL